MNGYVWLEFSDGALMKREVELVAKPSAGGGVRITNKEPVEFGPIQNALITATIMGVTDDPTEGAREPFYKTVQTGDVVRFPGA